MVEMMRWLDKMLLLMHICKTALFHVLRKSSGLHLVMMRGTYMYRMDHWNKRVDSMSSCRNDHLPPEVTAPGVYMHVNVVIHHLERRWIRASNEETIHTPR